MTTPEFKSLLETSCSYNRHPPPPGTLATLPSTATELILLYLSPSMVFNGDILSFAMAMPVNFRVWLVSSRRFADKHLRRYPEYTAKFTLQHTKSAVEYQKWFRLPHTYKMSLFTILCLKDGPSISPFEVLSFAIVFGKHYALEHILIENPELTKTQLPDYALTACVEHEYKMTMATVLKWDLCSETVGRQALMFAVMFNKPGMIGPLLTKFPEMVNDSRLMDACICNARLVESSQVVEFLLEFLLQTDSAQLLQSRLNDALQSICAPRNEFFGDRVLPESKELVGAVKHVLSFQNCDPTSNNCKALLDSASQRYTKVVGLFLHDERISDFHKKSMCCLYALRHGVTVNEITDLDERLDADLIIEMVASMSKEELMDHLPALVTGSQAHLTYFSHASKSANDAGATLPISVHETGNFIEHEKVAYSAFPSAVRLKNMNLLNALIETPGSSITHRDGRGIEALSLCIEDGYIEALSRILPLLPSPRARSICTQAIKADKMDILEILLNDQTRRPEEYPVVHQAHLLHAAVQNRSYPAVKLLLVHYNSDQHGSHRILQENLYNSLMASIAQGDVEIVKLLLGYITEISDSDCAEVCKAASDNPSLLEVLRKDGRFDISAHLVAPSGDLHSANLGINDATIQLGSSNVQEFQDTNNLPKRSEISQEVYSKSRTLQQTASMNSSSVPQASEFKSLLETSCSYDRHPPEPGTLAAIPSTATERILLHLSPSMMFNGDILSFAMAMPVNFRVWLVSSRHFADKHLRHYPEYTFKFNLQHTTSEEEYQKWSHLPHSYKMSLFPILCLNGDPFAASVNLLHHANSFDKIYTITPPTMLSFAITFGKYYILQHLLSENPELARTRVSDYALTSCTEHGYKMTMASVLAWNLCSETVGRRALQWL
ncbi:hypothetical protein HDU81_004313 [Chytriomyces hyalinus]|nr:hypothetical protein HDU81_004313 [Chytriomyces hyalinus]